MTIFAGLRLQGCLRRSNGKVRNGLEYEVVGFDSKKVLVRLGQCYRRLADQYVTASLRAELEPLMGPVMKQLAQ